MSALPSQIVQTLATAHMSAWDRAIARVGAIQETLGELPVLRVPHVVQALEEMARDARHAAVELEAVAQAVRQRTAGA